MKPLFWFFIVLLFFCDCQETGIPLGDKNIATYQWLSVYFEWDLNTLSIEAWNESNEYLEVQMRQKRDNYWYDVFNVRLRKKTESGHHHVEEDVDFNEGDVFELSIRKMDWSNPQKMWVKLEYNTSGSLQAVSTDST